jgi:hypothetical protein
MILTLDPKFHPNFVKLPKHPSSPKGGNFDLLDLPDFDMPKIIARYFITSQLSLGYFDIPKLP